MDPPRKKPSMLLCGTAGPLGLRPSLQRPDVKCPVAYKQNLASGESVRINDKNMKVMKFKSLRWFKSILNTQLNNLLVSQVSSPIHTAQSMHYCENWAILWSNSSNRPRRIRIFHSNNADHRLNCHFGPHGCQYWPDWRDPDRLEVPHPESQLFQTPKLWTKMTPLMKNLETQFNLSKFFLLLIPRPFPAPTLAFNSLTPSRSGLILVHLLQFGRCWFSNIIHQCELFNSRSSW